MISNLFHRGIRKGISCLNKINGVTGDTIYINKDDKKSVIHGDLREEIEIEERGQITRLNDKTYMYALYSDFEKRPKRKEKIIHNGKEYIIDSVRKHDNYLYLLVLDIEQERVEFNEIFPNYERD